MKCLPASTPPSLPPPSLLHLLLFLLSPLTMGPRILAQRSIRPSALALNLPLCPVQLNFFSFSVSFPFCPSSPPNFSLLPFICRLADFLGVILAPWGMTTQDWDGAIVPSQTPHEINRLQRTSSLVDLAARDGVPFPQRPAINQSLPYMNMLTRAYSVPNVNQYTGAIGPYRPSMPVYTYYSYKGYFPYRNYRGYTLADSYWYDRYYYFSPIYKRSMFPIRYRHSDYKSNPSYWHYPHTFWSYPYQGKWYDYDNPTNYRPYFDAKRSANFARPYHYRSHMLAHPFNHPQGMIHRRF